MLPEPKVLMAAAPQQVFPDRCLWARHKGASCTLCVDACPTDALLLSGRDVLFDEERCVGCGVCLTTCPVEYFETPAWSERNLVRAVEPLPRGEAVEIVCRQHPAPQQTAGSATAVQVNGCLGALSPGLWFELALDHPITVRLEACAGCPLGGAARIVEQAVELAREWLESCERPVTITLRRAAVASPRRPQPLLRAEEIRRSRRELLFAFARSAGPPTQALACLPTAFQDVDDPRRTPPHQPAWLRRLAALYPRAAARGTPQGAAAPSQEPSPCVSANWPTLLVDETCSACGSCARYCPSGALSTGRNRDEFEHRFIPGTCISCGLCALVCQPGSITRGYEAEETPFVERVVAARAVESCTKCGSPATGSAHGLCYWCANEPPMRSVLENAQDLFARR